MKNLESCLVSAKSCLDPSGRECKIKNVGFFRSKIIKITETTRTSRIVAIWALIVAFKGSKIQSLDLFLDKTRQESRTRLVLSQYFQISRILVLSRQQNINLEIFLNWKFLSNEFLESCLDINLVYVLFFLECISCLDSMSCLVLSWQKPVSTHP